LVFALGGLFLLLSITPYLVPLRPLPGDRHEMAFANSMYYEADGVELHYRSWGSDSAGEKVLLVHGLGGSTFSWRYTAPALSENGYKTIAVDLPGFGLSERAVGFDHTAERRAELLWSFLDHLYPGERWHLVGHSMGGATVTAMALQNREQVQSVTLAAGALAAFEPSIRDLLLRYPPFSRWLAVLSPRFILSESRVEQFLASAYGRQPSPEEVEGYYLPLTIKDTDAVLADLLRSRRVPLLERVGDLDIPVLCLWGENDTWVPLEQGEDLSRLIPGAELIVLPGEGHCPMETAPDQFNAELLVFLEAVN
jgi:pimeloyl-ACP methyl ester carboxylesterase